MCACEKERGSSDALTARALLHFLRVCMQARGANGTPSTADHNGSGSKSSSSGTANLPQTSPDQNSMAPPPPPKAVAAKDGAGAVKLAKPVEPTRPPSTTGAAESVKGSVVGSVKGSGGKGAEGKSGEEEEEEDAEAPRGRRMRSSGMGGEIGGFTQMSWLRVPPPESARESKRPLRTTSCTIWLLSSPALQAGEDRMG